MSLPLQEFFFTFHRSQDFFCKQASLAGIFLEELSPYLQLVLMVRPKYENYSKKRSTIYTWYLFT